ncbi:MAG: hypothetical protein OHK0039_15650 [Bacteroidia bacterium]
MLPPEQPSHDPRMNRLNLPYGADQPHTEGELGHWQTFEVFQQRNRGDQHLHVGSLHAPNPEMALVLAKEQYGRREQCANLWVVRSRDVFATSYEDADMFQHAFDKNYRESSGYRVKDTIEQFQKDLEARLLQHERPLAGTQTTAGTTAVATTTAAWKAHPLPDIGYGPRKILTRK